jgi:hypothetical protein
VFRKPNNQVKKLEMRITDLKNRLSAYSVSSSMIEEIEDLEEKLADAEMKRT